jgi:hypothetical protein
VRNADCVAVVDQGRVAELGTHEELLDQGKQGGGRGRVLSWMTCMNAGHWTYVWRWGGERPCVDWTVMPCCPSMARSAAGAACTVVSDSTHLANGTLARCLACHIK